MSVSCGCDFEGGTCYVGDPRQMNCRTPRECHACKKSISAGDKFYAWSRYDFDDAQTRAPRYFCEECGDMSLNLMELGFCFDLSYSVREQWLEYLAETDPNNPALRSN